MKTTMNNSVLKPRKLHNTEKCFKSFSFWNIRNTNDDILDALIDEKQGKDLESSAFDNVETHLARISGLQLHLNAIQFSLEPILRACVHHLHPHSR